MIKTMEHSNHAQKRVIGNILGKQESTVSEIKAVTKIMHDTGAVNYCKSTALKYVEESKSLIEKLNVSVHYRQILGEYAEFLMQRSR